MSTAETAEQSFMCLDVHVCVSMCVCMGSKNIRLPPPIEFAIRQKLTNIDSELPFSSGLR